MNILTSKTNLIVWRTDKMAARRVKPVSRKHPSKIDTSDSGESGDDVNYQKREYDRVRRRRLKSFGHLYRLFESTDSKICYYCGKLANALDHCPSLLMVDGVGVSYFEEQGIPFLLIPACGTCNNDIGTAHVFREGRVVRLDWRSLMKNVRANKASMRRNGG
jgi:hypothetical protein